MNRKSTKSDLARLDAMRDEDIDYSDPSELDEGFFEKATVHWPPHKKQLTIRLDGDVLDWLKRQGRGGDVALVGFIVGPQDGIDPRLASPALIRGAAAARMLFLRLPHPSIMPCRFRWMR